MSSWSFGAVGDVFLRRADPRDAFEGAQPVLNAADVLFGNCEGAFTNAPRPHPASGWPVVAPSSHAAPIIAAGFDVMACANNHILDAGYEAMLETLELLRNGGVQTVGAGRNLAEAREPRFLDFAGTRVGFLGFSSVHPPKYAATDRTPGVAALRILSHYHIPSEDAYGYIEPGSPPQVFTCCRPDDVAMLQEAVRKLRSDCDVAVTSFHWGRSSLPAFLTEYERQLGRAAVDAGADIVLGHHHHMLRGIELYRGKPIFYGLGHFVFDTPDKEKILTPQELDYLRSLGEYAIYPREGYPMLPFHPEARMTMMAAVKLNGGRIDEVGFIPFTITPSGHALPALAGSAEFERVLAYMRDVSKRAAVTSEYDEKGFGFGDWRAISVRN
jgi:poly-gamma-glutamate capsule biosynthesis protein CapA/YwtB (metallophosphatase superfamily)